MVLLFCLPDTAESDLTIHSASNYEDGNCAGMFPGILSTFFFPPLIE